MNDNKTFHISVPVADEELAADRLWQLGVEAVGIGEAVDGRVELWTSVGGSQASIDRAVARLEPGWSWHTAAVVQPDETWREFAEPTWYRSNGVVVPAWQVDTFGQTSGDDDVGSDRVVTAIEPASSFGLGDHPTTRLSLRSVATCLDSGKVDSLLDVGCGSGVIGIMAAQRGVRRVRSTDVSAGAIEATVSNASINGVAAVVEADLASLDTLSETFDVVVANILAPVLVDLAVDLRRLTAPDGVLVISGVLADNHQHVLDALNTMQVVAVESVDGWAAITLRH